jgi:hypothetical protein
MAETAIPEVPDAPSTATPGIETLLALKTLHPGLVVLIELVEIHRSQAALP